MFLSKHARALLGSSAGVLLATALFVAPTAANSTETVLHQVGTYDYLTQPDFTGLATVEQIAEGNTIGLGTFANLDGELVMVGGEIYRVRPDGKPRIVDPQALTPFMQAIDFSPARSVPVPPGTQCSALNDVIQSVTGQRNGIIAIRVRGTFTELTTRSITADPPPFQPLSQTIAEQTTFDLDGSRAVLVGFWQGRDALGVGQDGLHLHGLTIDRNAGGHVLSCTLGNDVQLSVQPVSRVALLTPPN